MNADTHREAMPSPVEIDSSSPVPAYYQVYEWLRSQLGTAELVAGTRLATERRMAEEIGVSRQTIRQALARLEREGRVYRRQGDGTYVSEPRVDSRLESVNGFTTELRARGMRVRSQVLDMRLVTPPASIRTELGLEDPQALAIMLRRVRSLDGVPAALETVWMPEALCGAIMGVDMEERSLYATLDEYAGIQPAAASESLTATVLDDFEAGELDRRPGDPAFLVERITRDTHGRIFEAVKSILRADRFAFRASLEYEATVTSPPPAGSDAPHPDGSP